MVQKYIDHNHEKITKQLEKLEEKKDFIKKKNNMGDIEILTRNMVGKYLSYKIERLQQM